MKMSVEEILALYNENRSRETMELIARANDCTIKDVGEFLKAAAANQEPKKKPGRPKKDSTQNRNLTSEEKQKKDTAEKVETKTEILPVNKRHHTYLVPEIVVTMTSDKIKEYRRMAKYHEEKMEEYNLMALECEEFLMGGFCGGSKDGIFREV